MRAFENVLQEQQLLLVADELLKGLFMRKLHSVPHVLMSLPGIATCGLPELTLERSSGPAKDSVPLARARNASAPIERINGAADAWQRKGRKLVLTPDSIQLSPAFINQ
jgi:hypothetical protein